MILPFAHMGHVLIDLPIFLGPVAVLVAWLLVMKKRDTRLDARERRGPGGSAG